MKQFYFSVFFLTYSWVSVAQMNMIIPFDACNPNAIDLTYDGSKYYIPVLCSENMSVLITVGEEVNYYDYSNISFSTAPLSIMDDQIFLYGKDRSMANGLKVCKATQEDYLCMDSTSILEPSEYDFPTGSINILGKFMFSYNYGPPNNSIGNIGLVSMDEMMNISWQKTYDSHLASAYVMDLEKSDDNLLLMSYIYRNETGFGSFPALSIIDTSGFRNLDIKLNERLNSGNTPVYNTQLSNGNIILSYEVDRKDDPVFIGNEWNKTPTILHWFNRDGEFIKEKYIIGPRTQQIKLKNIDSGFGDYFFAYGSLLGEDDIRAGLITKYSNEGDTIWSHKYQHSEFSGLDHGYWIRDIIEHENGSISVQSHISTVGELQRIWLFELNEHGCYGDQTACGDYVIVGETTDTEEVDVHPTSAEPTANITVRLAPNPAQEFVMLKSDLPLIGAETNIYSQDGKLIKSLVIDEEKIIDLTELNNGIYLIRINALEFSITKKLVVSKR